MQKMALCHKHCQLVLNPEQSFITCKRRPGSSSTIWTPPRSPAPGRWPQQARLFALGNWHKACRVRNAHVCHDEAPVSAVWGGLCVSAVSPVVAVDVGDSPGTVAFEAHPLQLSLEPLLVSSCKQARHLSFEIMWVLTLHTHQIYKTEFVCVDVASSLTWTSTLQNVVLISRNTLHLSIFIHNNTYTITQDLMLNTDFTQQLLTNLRYFSTSSETMNEINENEKCVHCNKF